MQKQVHIFFDLDDTMLRTQEGYRKVTRNTGNKIVEFIDDKNIDIETVLSKGNEIDVAASLELGLTKERFPLSWAKTYRYFMNELGKPTKPSHEKEIMELANKVYDDKFELYQLVHETLLQIKQTGAVMHILTAGDEGVQNQRVDDAGLRKYFSNIYVVTEKTPEVMATIVGGRSNSIMIGNSLRSDIYPALENGMTAIHIERDTWVYDQYEIDKSNGNYYVIEEFHQLPQVLHSIMGEVSKEAV